MSWPVKIGVTADGRALIGASEVDGAEADGTLNARDKVYGSQLNHRVRVLTEAGWIITTPTRAKELEAEGKASEIKGGW